jgi:hypothetical protein
MPQLKAHAWLIGQGDFAMLGVIATRIGELGANILEVGQQRRFLDVSAKGKIHACA